MSTQVNTDESGCNIEGDVANTPSLAIDPIEPNRMVIGWRQFDSIESDFRQGGVAYSHDGGATWTSGLLQPRGTFGTLPVLDSGPNGEFYYNIRGEDYRFAWMYESSDGGVSWSQMPGIPGGTPWFVVDKTESPGRGNIYGSGVGYFWRYVPAIDEWDFGFPVDNFGGWLPTLAVAADGSVYIVNGYGSVALVKRPFDLTTRLEVMDGIPSGLPPAIADGVPNQHGDLGQLWIVAEPPQRNRPDEIYVLSSGEVVMLAAAKSRRRVWRDPVRINDNVPNGVTYHWFGTMCIAPSGRLDVFWNDTRNTTSAIESELFYSYSTDEGRTWAENVAVSPAFNTQVGRPPDPYHSGIGYYYHCVSDKRGATIAYAATFNGEQDIYLLRVEPQLDCNDNGMLDATEVANKVAPDCNNDLVPNECERDWDSDGLVDGCDDDVDGDGVANDSDVCATNHVGAPVDAEGRPVADSVQIFGYGEGEADCIVDLVDFIGFSPCMTTQGRLCQACFDNTADGTLDLRDYANLQNAFGYDPAYSSRYEFSRCHPDLP